MNIQPTTVADLYQTDLERHMFALARRRRSARGRRAGVALAERLFAWLSGSWVPGPSRGKMILTQAT